MEEFEGTPRKLKDVLAATEEEKQELCEWKEETECNNCWYFTNGKCALNLLKEMID